jgi:hypothetical protein
MSILSAEGTVTEFQDLLKSKSLATKAIEPQPWTPFRPELATVSANSY